MLEYFMYCYADDLLLLVLCAIAGCFGLGLGRVWKVLKPKLEKFFDRYFDDETKLKIARTAVCAVEQIWKSLHGSDKMAEAIKMGREMMAKKGIDFDEEEFRILCEAVLAEFNDAFRKPLVAEDTAAATYRVEE